MMIKKLFLLVKNQWLFIKEYGIVEEIIRIGERISWYIKTYLFKSDFREKAREDLKIIKKIFKEKGVSFFLSDGTCLGAVREGDFIKWDADIDLAVIENTPPQLIDEIRERLCQAGFKIIRSGHYQKGCREITCKRRAEVSVLWFQREGKYFIWMNRHGKLEIQIPTRLFAKFREANLGKEKYLIPDPPEIYLEKVYGDWQTPKKRAGAKVIITD